MALAGRVLQLQVARAARQRQCNNEFGASSIDGVALVGRRGLAKRLKTPGELSADDRAALAEFLASRFVAAMR